MSKMNKALREVLSGTPLRIGLAVFLGFLVGGLFMAVFSEDVIATYGTFGSNPLYTFQTAGQTVLDGYGALLRGSIFNPNGRDVVAMFRPLTETLRLSAPLIIAGLGVALGFRVGLFNVGGTGQLIMGLLGATWVSTRLELQWGVHMLVAVVTAIAFAAIWGAIVGLLKARTGAHEVIVTIMLNYVALNLFSWVLREPNLLLEKGGAGTPKSDPPALTAQLPDLLGTSFKLHLGIVFAALALFGYWWLMERSTIGYRFKMVGHNSFAAKAAGISVEKTFIWAMAASAAFMGLAAANQGLGESAGITPSLHANIGFDAITVALLGGSKTRGILFAGLLFGAFKSGGPSMQVAGVSPQILAVVQALIVLFVAAPPIIKAIFKLPTKEVK